MNWEVVLKAGSAALSDSDDETTDSVFAAAAGTDSNSIRGGAAGGVGASAHAGAGAATGSAKLPRSNDEFVQMSLQERESEYTVKETTRFYIGTWNVNTKRPDSGGGGDGSNHLATFLHPWITGFEDDSAAPGVCAFGFQEVDMSAEAVLLNETSSGKPWINQIEAEINRGAVKYQIVATRQLAGILIIVLAKKALTAFISKVQTEHVGVGILGLMGNKVGLTPFLFPPVVLLTVSLLRLLSREGCGCCAISAALDDVLFDQHPPGSIARQRHEAERGPP
jgi:hypothetical protein